MKLVDADALIKKLQNDYHGMISDESMKIYQIIRMLNEAPTVQSDRATIYDLHRVCKYYDGDCSECPLNSFECTIDKYVNKEELDKINDAISEWVLSHPTKTRQDVFLEQYPEATVSNGILIINPCGLDAGYAQYAGVCDTDCGKCRREYWLGEAEEVKD